MQVYLEATNGEEIGDVLKTVSLAALLLMALALAALLVRGAFFSSQPVVITAEVAAVALMAWARLTFGRRSFNAAANPKAGGLVTTGPYRYIRHPIYTAACLFGWSGILAHWSLINVLLGALLIAGAVARMLCEERLIIEVYPEYRDYAQATKRMVPYIF
jgi:protein-S-isoprenylcysteine O-methyltransferase Ste14